jgi:iron uptake system EfeUOB component EfeO/EfeM
MDSTDFNKLMGLLSKFTAATEKAYRTDGTFKRYHQLSTAQLRELPEQLRRIEQGLRTAKIIK